MDTIRLPQGFKCGHATHRDAWTGCTVILTPPNAIGSGELRGGGPGTYESDLLSPATSTPGPQAVLLTGGSAFGLAATDGVTRYLAEKEIGHPTPMALVPLVCGAVVYDLLLGDASLEDVVVSSGLLNLDLAPASRALSGAQVELVELPDRDHRLARALGSPRERSPRVGGSPPSDPGGSTPNAAYDLILIDTPPSLGVLTLNALAAADGVVVPVQCEYLALEGLGQLVETLELVRGSLNPRLALLGILLTMHDPRTNLSNQVADEVRRHFPAATLGATIPRSVRLSEAPSHGRPIRLYDPSSRGAEAYAACARELTERLNRIGDRDVGVGA